MLKKSVLILLISFTVFACEHESLKPKEAPSATAPPVNTDCDPNKLYFEDDILPIFVSNCAFSGCHDAGTAKKGIILTTYSNIINTGGIIPSDTNSSEVYDRITDTNPADRMPLNRPALSQTQIDAIATWIMEGAPNSSCKSSQCDTTNVTFSLIVEPIIQSKCVGCHNAGSLGGGVALDTYLAIRTEALSLRLLNVITHQPGFKAMPLGGNKLPDCEINQIRAWINAGSLNN